MGVTQKIKEGSKSNNNSSRTSPSRIEDSEFVNNSLLASNNGDFYESAVSLEPPQKLYSETVSSSLIVQNHCPARENMDSCHVKVQQCQPGRSDSGNSSAVYPLKSNDDENLDYDSNASSSSFEFHKGERVAHRSLTRSLSRPTSYKWNDAEKWIMSKQAGQANHTKSLSISTQNGGSLMTGLNLVRVAPEAASHDYRSHPRMPEMKRVDFSQPGGQIRFNKVNLAHPEVDSVPVQSNVPIDLYPDSNELREVGNVKNSTQEVPGMPAIREISMRDMGTEMTPVTSQEPSRTATPNGSLTPFRSPTSSIPSTPRTGEPTTTPLDCTADSNVHHLTEKGDRELSEHELKLKTRKEIVALGVQLGKVNIAAWASKDEKDNSSLPIADSEELERIEFEKRAAAWEEAEKSKHAARYKRDEIKIQVWESQQKAKLEEELRRMEAKVERLRTTSQAKMMKKISIARKRSEEKRAAAESQKKRQSEKTAARVEYIRQTGRTPPSDYTCCGFL